MEGWELVAIGGDPDERLLYSQAPCPESQRTCDHEQRSRYYVSRGLDPQRSPQRDAT